MGTAKLVASGDEIAADLKETFDHATSRRAADVKLRLIVPPKMASIVRVQRVSPTVIDVTKDVIAVDERTFDYPTGAWSAEERDFHVVVEMKQAGRDRRADAHRAHRARHRRQGRGPAGGHRHLERRCAHDDRHRPAGRPLHRPGRARGGDPRGFRGARKGQCPGGDRQARQGDEARPRFRQRGSDAATRQGRRRRRCGQGHRPPPLGRPEERSPRRRSRRDADGPALPVEDAA